MSSFIERKFENVKNRNRAAENFPTLPMLSAMITSIILAYASRNSDWSDSNQSMYPYIFSAVLFISLSNISLWLYGCSEETTETSEARIPGSVLSTNYKSVPKDSTINAISKYSDSKPVPVSFNNLSSTAFQKETPASCINSHFPIKDAIVIVYKRMPEIAILNFLAPVLLERTKVSGNADDISAIALQNISDTIGIDKDLIKLHPNLREEVSFPTRDGNITVLYLAAEVPKDAKIRENYDWLSAADTLKGARDCEELFKVLTNFLNHLDPGLKASPDAEEQNDTDVGKPATEQNWYNSPKRDHPIWHLIESNDEIKRKTSGLKDKQKLKTSLVVFGVIILVAAASCGFYLYKHYY